MIELNIPLSEVMSQISDDELANEVKRRDLGEDFCSDVDEDKIREEEYEYLKKDNHVLPKLFDRFQLRDHLISIAGLGSYVSDEKLFDTLADFLNSVDSF